MQHKSLKIVGIMSGTSLDGLDLALCDFSHTDGKISLNLLASETISYTQEWKSQLGNVFLANAEAYFKTHHLYGKFIAEAVTNFLSKNQQTANYIASHGHTVFHQPQQGFTTQIGCGATIAAKTGIDTICDFRSLDVALHGQGAPLVPIGDRDLFYQHEACLNIGGIANISFTKNRKTLAFDICIANMALNYLAEKLGHSYDANGGLAATGSINTSLLDDLLKLNTNQQSLGKEWFDAEFLPVLNQYNNKTEDLLATCAEYTAIQITNTLNTHSIQSVLITGGGTYNSFLLNRLKTHYNGVIEIPNDQIIQFKEAIIFAYLGYLRVTQQINTLSSVTKANRDSIGGAIYSGPH